MRRLCTFLLLISSLILLFGPAQSANFIVRAYNQKEYWEVSQLAERDLSQYKVDETAIFASIVSCETIIDAILSQCSFTRSISSGNVVIDYYESEALANYLPMYETNLLVCKINDSLSIEYDSVDGKRVYLSYYDGGMSIGMRDKETGLIETMDREGNRQSYYAQDREIWVKGEIIKNTTGMHFDRNSMRVYRVGTYYLTHEAPEWITNHRGSDFVGFENADDLLADLQNDFPDVSFIAKTENRYCPALESYVSARAQYSRTAQSATDLIVAYFSQGSFLGDIAINLGIPSDKLSLIFSAMNVVINGSNQIMRAVNMIKSGTVPFIETRKGQVYDTIRYYGYFAFYTINSQYYYHGGYIATGEFTWTSTIPPYSTNPNSYTWVIDQVMSVYNSAMAEYMANGYSYPWFPPLYGPDDWELGE